MGLPVTFLMPVKNGQDFLNDSMLNILAMATAQDEILVVDDQSTDRTKFTLDVFRETVSNLVVLSNPRPGLANALNFGIKQATNNIIARVDVDDSYAANRISKQLEYFTSTTVAIFSDYKFFSTECSDLGTVYSAVNPIAVSASLISSQRTPHPSVVFSRESVIEVGGYRESDFPAEDLSLWLRLSRVGELKSVPLPLLNYRMNPHGVSATKRTKMIKKKNSLIFEIGLNDSDLEKLENSIQDILLSYQSDTYGSERRILFAKDLLKISKTYKRHQHLRNFSADILLRELLSGDLLPIARRLAIEKIKRARLRG